MTVPHDLAAVMPPCQCDGTGFYVVNVARGGFMEPEERACALHQPPPPRVPAGTELGAHAPTAEPQFWQLLCNGIGPGRLIGYVEAAWLAKHHAAHGTLETGLSWIAQPTQDSRMPAREFTLTPLTDEEMVALIRKFPVLVRDIASDAAAF